MVINHLEKLFVTNDAATIIRELEVVHPAAKLLVMASQQQEQEVFITLFMLKYISILVEKLQITNHFTCKKQIMIFFTVQ